MEALNYSPANPFWRSKDPTEVLGPWLDYHGDPVVHFQPDIKALSLSGLAARVLFYIWYSLDPNSDSITLKYTDIMELCSLSSRATVNKGLKELSEAGYITKATGRSQYYINPYKFIKL